MDVHSSPFKLNRNGCARRALSAVLCGLAASAFVDPAVAGVSTEALSVSLTIEAAGCSLVSVSNLERFGLETDSSRINSRETVCDLRGSGLAPTFAPLAVTSGVLSRGATTPTSGSAATPDRPVPEPVEMVTITY